MSGATAMSDVFPLEEFQILGPIGRGEFGKVHRATWTTRHVDVALKHIEVTQGPAKLDAERHGVRLQELVWQQHPQIVPRIYLDGLSGSGDYYIAMEFVRGESLHDILRRTRLSQDRAVRLARILASILQRLHAFHPPILHSDLKPEHVLVLDDGSVRIIDFGIARRPEVGAATHNAFLSVMYAAPERVDDEARNVHPSDDLWALGIMFFEMLAGRHPREIYRAQIEDAVRRDDLVTVATLLREKPAVTWRYDVATALPLVHTDAAKLKVVVKNLVANAVKFTERGYIALSATPRDDGVEVAVSDSGIGIAPDALPIIFEAFRQADSSMTRRHGGVGLGLHVVRRLMTLLGGRVAVDSTPGSGSTFRVWIPLAGPSAAAR